MTQYFAWAESYNKPTSPNVDTYSEDRAAKLIAEQVWKALGYRANLETPMFVRVSVENTAGTAWVFDVESKATIEWHCTAVLTDAVLTDAVR